MDPGRVVFDSGVARRACPGGGGGGAQMLLFGGGGFLRGVPTAVLGLEDSRSSAAGGKRPFFTTHEELLEEEYYDEQAPEKKRRLTAEQVQMLERSFEEENKLEPERKTELARRLGMAPRQVAVWFQNRRARWKTKQLEHDFDRLKAAYDALAADHHGLLSDNDRLRAQVISLTEKLQDKETSPSSATITTAAQEVDQPDEHTEAASTTGFATVDDALAAPPPGHQQQPPKDDLLSSGGTNDGGGVAVVVFDVTEGANDHLSCESAYFADAVEAYDRGCAGRYALSSEEEDGGAVSDEGCSFNLPDDAMFGAAGVVHHDAADEEAQLGSWTAWFWS